VIANFLLNISVGRWAVIALIGMLCSCSWRRNNFSLMVVRDANNEARSSDARSVMRRRFWSSPRGRGRTPRPYTLEDYCGFYFGQPAQHDRPVVKHDAFNYLANATDPACVFSPF